MDGGKLYVVLSGPQQPLKKYSDKLADQLALLWNIWILTVQHYDYPWGRLSPALPRFLDATIMRGKVVSSHLALWISSDARWFSHKESKKWMCNICQFYTKTRMTKEFVMVSVSQRDVQRYPELKDSQTWAILKGVRGIFLPSPFCWLWLLKLLCLSNRC